jgi:hypothetical protein
MKERMKCSEADAQAALSTLKNAFRKGLPSEWRFTRHPSGFFFICDVSLGVKYFGISFRSSPLDEEFRKDIDTFRMSDDRSKEVKSRDEKIARLKIKFQEILQNPESEICHEIKTVYEPGWGIYDIQKGFEELKKQGGRPLKIEIEREAIRPNAIILNGEIWARQDVWIHMKKPDLEYLLFERLTMHGLDKACIKVFAFLPSGELEQRKGMPISPRSIYLPRRKPQHEYEGFHTESYWSLPTEIEKTYLDLLFKQRKSQRDASVHLDDKDNKTLLLIRKILDTGTMKA